MDNREKLDKMDRALRLLEDLKNSQVALIEKSSQLQMDAMSFNFLGFKYLKHAPMFPLKF